MAEVRWTPQAADDLESIADYIAKDSPHYARLFVIDVLKAIERLTNFPGFGSDSRVRCAHDLPCDAPLSHRDLFPSYYHQHGRVAGFKLCACSVTRTHTTTLSTT